MKTDLDAWDRKDSKKYSTYAEATFASCSIDSTCKSRLCILYLPNFLVQKNCVNIFLRTLWGTFLLFFLLTCNFFCQQGKLLCKYVSALLINGKSLFNVQKSLRTSLIKNHVYSTLKILLIWAIFHIYVLCLYYMGDRKRLQECALI